MQTEQLVQVAIDALEDLKAQDIVTLDVRDKTSVTDYMVIACGSSSRQVKSLADNVLTKAKENGVKPLGSEGLESGEWALLGHFHGAAHMSDMHGVESAAEQADTFAHQVRT